MGTATALRLLAEEPPPEIGELRSRFPGIPIQSQETKDRITTVWVPRDSLRPVLRYLKEEAPLPFRLLFDLTLLDNRLNGSARRAGVPSSDFIGIYHLLSIGRNRDIRLKVALEGSYPELPTITDLWPAANWYECEAWDMFGVRFAGHPKLRRILMPKDWSGHPLRKEHPARATEMGPFQLPDEKRRREQELERFVPEDWGLKRAHDGSDFMFLNLGPHHPGTHGVLRIILQLDGETIVDAVPEIGFHHRAAEKMGERQTWHTYIPYTDRVDYLAGSLNNLAYLSSVETLAGITVPDRAKVIRVMLSELFRISNHLVWYGTFAQDIGQLSPVFYMFTDREKLFTIIESVCGARMHPSWFRIGGVAADLPQGWERLVREFVAYLPSRLDEYEAIVMRNPIFRARTRGVGKLTLEQAIEWGITGPNLRACGLDWDYRKKRPYSGYDWFDFDIPTSPNGDCYDRAVVRIEEMRQSLRIIQQCLQHMPSGAYKAEHPLATPPIKPRTMEDIETLITHFLNVSWGPPIAAGEACVPIENAKGANGYYVVSDGNTHPYRVRIRTPSFAHMQALPLMCRGLMVADLMAILGAMDYVLSDVDR